jgi:2-methylcitrate dehydratase PrpD
MDSERGDLGREAADLGVRWEIVDTGITVKLYPSCAGTHPSLDAILSLRQRERITPDEVDRIEIDVDRIVPTILIYDRPATGLEGKFSMPFCAAAAIVFGHVGVETFEPHCLSDPRVSSLMSRVRMTVDPALGVDAPSLTQARVRVHLRDGRILTGVANGARGYPENPASDAELDTKFLSCAARTIPEPQARQALALLRRIEQLPDLRELLSRISTAG